MSGGYSTSLTFIASRETARALVQLVNETGDLPDYERLPKSDLPLEEREDCWMHSSYCRAMEEPCRQLLKEYFHPSLAYYRTWDDPLPGVANAYVEGVGGYAAPWAVALDGEALVEAIAGWRHFFSALRADPSRCLNCHDCGRSIYGESEIVAGLAEPWPADLMNARKWNEDIVRGDEGRSFVAAISFLWAHSKMLELAQSRDLGLVYGLWLGT